MNGEMYQICMLVNAARTAMAKGKEFAYSCDRYVNSIKFCFIPRQTFLGEEAREVYSPREWYENCIREGVDDMKILAPLQVSDKALLGFSNVSRSCMVAFHKDGQVTYWIAAWDFDKVLKKWNVEYQEYMWDNPPSEKPRFQDNTAELADILLKIGEFAERIECGNFGNIFRSARDILNGKKRFPTGTITAVQSPCRMSRKGIRGCSMPPPWRTCLVQWAPGMTNRLITPTRRGWTRLMIGCQMNC